MQIDLQVDRRPLRYLILRKELKMAKRVIAFGLVCVILSWATVIRADSYQLVLNLDIDKGQLDGQMFLRYDNSGPEQLKEIRLRLRMSLW